MYGRTSMHIDTPPPPPPEFPRRKGEVLIIGKVEYRFSFAGESAGGHFLITDKMLDNLRTLILQSEKELAEPFNTF